MFGDVEAGLNTDVRRNGRTYHVQTEGVSEPEPIVQSLIYDGGRILVRMTATYGELTHKFKLTGEDVRHVLELQHWNLVRKVQRGMLDDDEEAGTPDPQPAQRARAHREIETEVEIECEDPAVRKLLAELDRRVEARKRGESPPVPRVPAAALRRKNEPVPDSLWSRLASRLRRDR